MPLSSLADEKIGDVTIRIVHAKGGGYHGVLIRPGKPMGETHSGDDLNALRARLRNEAGKLHPDYLGMDGAIARFVHFFPGGFDDAAASNERGYKEASRRRLLDLLPLERATEANEADAVAVRGAFNTNMLSRFELARMHALLGSAQGADFVRAAAGFALGDRKGGLAGMVAAITPHGRPSWPMLTYLPHLWRHEVDIFLKPTVTVDFARRIGHPFQYHYAADPDAAVYESLLDLAEVTEVAIAALHPRDRTDVQSFIWVVGAYTDADLPHLEKLRADQAPLR